MAFAIDSGGGLEEGFFPDFSGSFEATESDTSVMGVKLDGVGAPYIVTVDDIPFLVTQTVDGDVSLTEVNPQSDAGPTRSEKCWVVKNTQCKVTFSEGSL